MPSVTSRPNMTGSKSLQKRASHSRNTVHCDIIVQGRAKLEYKQHNNLDFRESAMLQQQTESGIFAREYWRKEKDTGGNPMPNPVRVGRADDLYPGVRGANFIYGGGLTAFATV